MSKRAADTNGTRRGSPEAVEKRRAARRLNAVLEGTASPLDGRTENRRRRLITELKEGRRGRPLKPIDVVAHVNELLGLGETLASLRARGIRPRKADLTEEVLEVVRRTQEAYAFQPEAWLMLGVKLESVDRKK